jgi:PTS system nitrogen regulatory IIA component
MSKISKYLDPELVYFSQATTRDAVIKEMVELLNHTGNLNSEKEFYDALIFREKIISTGIGMGVAIPHAKMAGYENFFMAVGILPKGVDWNSLDGSPVRLVFMIGGPDNKQTEYLQILSNLTLAIKDEERRKKILTSNSPEAIIELFKAF